MRSIVLAIVASLAVALPAQADTAEGETITIGIVIEREQLIQADVNHDRSVTEAEFRAWLKDETDRLVAKNERHWAIMLKVMDGPDVKRLHAKESGRLGKRFVERLDTDRDGTPSPEELKAYASLIGLPPELEPHLEDTAKATLAGMARLTEEKRKKIEAANEALSEDEAYMSSDGGLGKGSDRRWLKSFEDTYMQAWGEMAEDGAVRID